MGAETVTYQLSGAAQRDKLVGLTTVFVGCQMVEQEYFDILAAVALANSNNSFSVCDNALKQVLDTNPYLMRSVFGGLHYYLPEQFDGDPKGSNNCMTVDTQGRWYLAGGVGPNANHMAVLRLNSDLSVDTTYGVNGWWIYMNPAWTGTYVQGVAFDRVGNLLIGAGIFGDGSVVPFAESGCCMRLLPNGTPDPTFNGGVPKLWAPNAGAQALGFGVAGQSDGKIIVTGATIRISDGSETIFATRLNHDGSIDTSFGTQGSIVTDVGGNKPAVTWAVVCDSQDRAYLGGSCETHISTTLQGSPGTAIAGSTQITLASTSQLRSSMYITIGTGATQEQQIVQGISGNLIGIYPGLLYSHSVGEAITWSFDMMTCVRLVNGNLDLSFNGTGYQNALFGTTSQGFAITLQSSGKPVVAGGLADIGGNGILVMRCNLDGTLDTSFGTNGDGSARDVDSVVGPGAQAIWCQNDDKIVTGDISSYGIDDNRALSSTRFNANGTIDTSYGTNGSVHYPKPPAIWLSANAIAVNPLTKDVCVSGPTGEPNASGKLVWAAGLADTNGEII